MDDTFTPDQLWRLALVMLRSSKATAERDLSLAMWLTMTIGRGDDARLVFLPDLLAPEVMRVIGEKRCHAVHAEGWGGVRVRQCSRQCSSGCSMCAVGAAYLGIMLHVAVCFACLP